MQVDDRSASGILIFDAELAAYLRPAPKRVFSKAGWML